MHKLFYILYQMGLLSLFILSCHGFGYQIIKHCTIFNISKNSLEPKNSLEVDKIFIICLAITLGMGCCIIFLQIFGILGYLNKVSTISIVSSGLVLFFIHFYQKKENLLIGAKNKSLPQSFNISHRLKISIFWILATLFILKYIIRSLTPPIAGDELLYHLPHAREWADAGYLSINKWLRYPYFPYNFDLLYTACLTLNNDVLPHLIHTLAGILILIGIFRISVLQFNRAIAWIALIVSSLYLKGLFACAYIDLGLTLFIFFSFYCAYLSYQNKNLGCFCISAFLLGLAMGTKYQALPYLLPFVLIVFLRERRLLHLTLICSCFLLPCIYWYMRNFLLTGNPFEPLAGSIFGYYSWNKRDMIYQLYDLKMNQTTPKVFLWPSFISIFLNKKKSSKFINFIYLFVLYTYIVWYFTSHYTRYLTPIYPFMIMLSAFSIYKIGEVLFSFIAPSLPIQKIINSFSSEKFLCYFYSLILALTIFLLINNKYLIYKYMDEIAFPESNRHNFLMKNVKIYEIGLFLKNHPEYQIVQRGFEMEMYYLPKNTIGDHFGEGRYVDFIYLSPDLLAKKIRSFHANAYLVPKDLDLESQPNFNKYFFLIMKNKYAKLYGLKS